MDIDMDSMPNSSNPSVLPPCLYLKWLLLYKPTVLAKPRLHGSHLPIHIKEPTWAPQPIYNKLSATTYELFNAKGASIFTLKQFLTARDKPTGFALGTFALMTPYDVEELRDIRHLRVMFFFEATRGYNAFDICCTLEDHLGFTRENSTECFVLPQNWPMFLNRLFDGPMLIIKPCNKKSTIMIFIRSRLIPILSAFSIAVECPLDVLGFINFFQEFGSKYDGLIIIILNITTVST